MELIVPCLHRVNSDMADNKENSKLETFTSLKCKSKTQLKDVNNVFRNMHSENNRANKNFENTCSVRSFYTLRSHSQSAVTELFGKTALDSCKLELPALTKKNIKVSSIPASSANRSDHLYKLQVTQEKQPEGKEFRQMSGRENSSENMLADNSTSLTNDLEINSDIGNDVIYNFSNMSLSKGTEGCKDMHTHSMPLSPLTSHELGMQRVDDGSSDIDSCYFGNVNHNPDGNFKRKIPNEVDVTGKQVKKKKEGTQLLGRSELAENDLCTVKRKCGENHDESNIKKKNKCDLDVQMNMLSIHFGSNLQTRDEEEYTSEHPGTELPEKNVICSADLITVINKIMYNNHDRPNLKFYPDMFLKCISHPSACTDDVHANDGTAEMEESKAFILKSLMRANLWASAFNNIYTFLTSENYLPTSLLRLLFNFIITASDTVLINKAVEIITCHWDMHPPCRENMRKHYLNLLIESETADKDLPMEVSNDGLLYCILNMLESVLENPDQNRKKLVRAVDFQGLLLQPVKHKVKPVSYQQMSDRWQNFDSFENGEIIVEHCKKKIIHEAPKESDQYLTHSEQTERLFLALELIVEVMERDMAVWLVKYSFTPFKYVHQNSCCPLIGNVYRTTTKQILKLYHLSGEHKHSRIFTRFIALLAEVARVSEIQDIEGKGLIQYPYFSTECYLFVEDVYTSFVQSSRTTDEKLELLDLLQPPWVRMFLASQWLSDNLGHNYGHDLECAIKILQSEIAESELFRNFSVECCVESCVHVEEKCRAIVENITCKETNEKKTSVPSQQRKKIKTSTSELAEETIHILIIMTSSYIKTYCLQEIYDTLKCRHLFENVIHNYSGQDRRGRVKLRFNYVQIVSDLQNYRQLRKLLKSLCECTQFNVLHNWLSVFYTNS